MESAKAILLILSMVDLASMDISESLRKAVVAILDDNGKVFGTGFFVTPDGYILTCYHVIEKFLSAKKVDIRTAEGGKLQATFEEDRSCPDKDIDFAILRVDDSGHFSCLPLGSDFEVGDEWYSLGYVYPSTYDCDSNQGTIFSKPPRLDSDNYDIRLKSELPIRGGFSGSPLLNMNTGKVIGVIKSRPEEEGSWEGFAAPIRDVFCRWPDLEMLNLETTKPIETPQDTRKVEISKKACNLPIQRSINSMESEKAKKLDYEYYLQSLKTKLSALIRLPLSRLLDPKKSVSTFDLYLETDKPKAQEIKSEELLLIDRSAVILGEPGSGKTYLLRYLTLKVAENFANNAEDIIPIIIDGKQWGHLYSSLVEFIYEELKLLVKGITHGLIESELSKNKFIIFIDGYDEIRKKRDVFKKELIKFITSYEITIVLTSRESNYHGELSPYFDIWKIKPLSEEQIDEFGQQVTSIPILSYRLRNQNLLELARLPLYLSMICQLVNKDKRIPNNIALLHSSFANYLLSEYPKQKDPAFEPNVPLEVKLDFLSELSKEQFKDSYFKGYLQCIKDKQWVNKKDLLFSEIQESGLLVGDPFSYMDWVHPTVAEFFLARSISLLSSDQIIAFTKENMQKEEIFEVLRLLIGLLRDQNEQKPLLDYLEENNLVIYLRCLDGRYHADVDNLQYYPDIEKQYLAQMQSSYNAQLDRYFNKSKILFPPFRGHLFDQSQIERLKVKVVGSLDAKQMTLSYRYSFVDPLKESIEPEINPSLPVITAVSFGKDRLIGPRFPIMASSSSDGCNYIDLHMAQLGIDSAREIVLTDIKKNLKNLIDKRSFLTLPLICEQLISEIHNAASTAVMFQDRVLEPIWKYENGIYEANEYYEAFLSIEHHSVIQSGDRGISLKLNDIVSKLKYLTQEDVTISKYVLPEFKKDNISNSKRKTDQYTSEHIQERIEQVYSLIPKLYSELVETYFPNLQKYLWHLSIYPFRYIIYYNKFNCTIPLLYCMPVRGEEDIKAIINIHENEKIIDSREEYERIRSKFMVQLKAFRGLPLENTFDMGKFYFTSTGINNAIGDHALMTGVYGLLEHDLKFIIK
jgi:hypothetical protein